MRFFILEWANGAVITNSNKIYKSIKLLKNNGIENRYEDKWNSPGLNFKFTDIQATILLEQIKKIHDTKKKIIDCNYKFTIINYNINE